MLAKGRTRIGVMFKPANPPHMTEFLVAMKAMAEFLLDRVLYVVNCAHSGPSALREADGMTLFEERITGAEALTRGYIVAWLATGSADIWSPRLSFVGRFRAHNDRVWRSSRLDGNRILSSSEDGSVRLIELALRASTGTALVDTCIRTAVPTISVAFAFPLLVLKNGNLLVFGEDGIPHAFRLFEGSRHILLHTES